MSRLVGVMTVLLVLLLAMGFAAANAGHRVTLSLGFLTLYQVPVTLVAFSGLFVGMLAMFATGIHSDLKVRRILRERLTEESRREQSWIDRNQQDLFTEKGGVGSDGAEDLPAEGADPAPQILPEPVLSGQTQVEPGPDGPAANAANKVEPEG
jgi:uncharacterized integral membrane protein